MAGLDPVLLERMRPRQSVINIQNPDGTVTQLPHVSTAMLTDHAIGQIADFISRRDVVMAVAVKVYQLHAGDARHIKKNQKISQWTLQEMCKHLIDEAKELHQSVRGNSFDLEELADCYAIMIAILTRGKQTMENLAIATHKKLDERFTFEPSEEDMLIKTQVDKEEKHDERKEALGLEDDGRPQGKTIYGD